MTDSGVDITLGDQTLRSFVDYQSLRDAIEKSPLFTPIPYIPKWNTRIEDSNWFMELKTGDLWALHRGDGPAPGSWRREYHAIMP